MSAFLRIARRFVNDFRECATVPIVYAYHHEMPPIADLPAIEAKLTKRGFRRDDLFLHKCEKCSEQAVLSYVIFGRVGGRDIKLCQACGDARSWRTVAGAETRQEDLGFDLRAFLG